MNFAASPLLSPELSPTNAACLPYLTPSDWNDGNSKRHGPHHDAHLFTTTGYPLRLAMRASNAFLPPPRIMLDWRCSEASGAGAPPSARFASTGGAALLFGWDVSAPAWIRPITTTATRRAHPAAQSSFRFTGLGCHIAPAPIRKGAILSYAVGLPLAPPRFARPGTAGAPGPRDSFTARSFY